MTAWLAIRYVDSEWQRDLRNWQVRLGIVGDSRYAAIDGWLDGQVHTLSALADNPSLQLYARQISMAPTDDESLSIIDSQTEYIRNLLEASALQSGFAGATASIVKANLPSSGTAGLALLNAGGEMVVGSSGLPPLAGPLREFVASLKPGEVQIRDLYKNAAGQPSIAFAVPVFAVQGSLGWTGAQIGTIIGVKEVAAELFPLLRQPGETSETATATLVRRDGNVIEYLTPLRDGTPPLTLRMATDTAGAGCDFRHGIARRFRPASRPSRQCRSRHRPAVRLRALDADVHDRAERSAG